MDQNRLTRRRFIISVIALSGAAGAVVEPGLFALSKAWAESPGRVDETVRRNMVRMARLLYPHDALSDGVYANVLEQTLSNIVSGDIFARQLEEANTALTERSAGAWQDLDLVAQIEAMKSIESETYFAAIQNSVRAGIYNGSAFWKHVGYPGPSKDFGGYLHHGAGEIDWLPENL
ncbi:MAG: hypothetical protein QNK22_03140 [Xanthomonadales bacterium]|nr:hypothetical protein [Xanthomonadales bacterium]